MTGYNALFNKSHPVWSIADKVLPLAALAAILYFNAGHPDKTEVSAWIQAAIAKLGYDWLRSRGGSSADTTGTT